MATAPAAATAPEIPAEPVVLDGLLPTNGLDLDIFQSGAGQAAPAIVSAASAAAAPANTSSSSSVHFNAASSILGQGAAAIPVGTLPCTAAPVDAPVQPQPAASAAHADLQAHGVFVAGTPAAVGCAGHLDAVAVAVSVEVGDHGWPFTDCSAFS